MASNGEANHTRTCPCGTAFAPVRARQIFCASDCHIRVQHLRAYGLAYTRGELPPQAAAVEAPAEDRVRCVKCHVNGVHAGDVRSGWRTCRECRAEERSLEHYEAYIVQRDTERRAVELAASRVRPRRTLTVGNRDFEIIWDGFGSLPGAEWPSAE